VFLKDEIDPNRTEEEEAYISQGITAFFTGEIMKQGIETAGTLDVMCFVIKIFGVTFVFSKMWFLRRLERLILIRRMDVTNGMLPDYKREN